MRSARKTEVKKQSHNSLETYEVTVTQKGQVTLPAELRKKEEWLPGTKLVFVEGEDGKKITVSKKVNLYDTEFGDYDFQSVVLEDPELSENKPVGKERLLLMK